MLEIPNKVDYSKLAFQVVDREPLVQDQALALLEQASPTLFSPESDNTLNEIARTIPAFTRRKDGQNSLILEGDVISPGSLSIPSRFICQAVGPYGDRQQYGHNRIKVIIQNHEYAKLGFRWDELFYPNGFSFYSLESGHGFKVDPLRDEPVYDVLPQHRSGQSPITAVEVDKGTGYTHITYQRGGSNGKVEKVFTVPTSIVYGKLPNTQGVYTP